MPDVPRLGVAHDAVEPTASGTPAGSTSAVDVPGPACDALGAIARENGVLPRDPGQRTRRRHRLQHDPLLRSRRRRCSAKHRKLVPTGGERTRVGHRATARRSRCSTRRSGASAGSICWENYMPLARVAMYEQRIDILLAPTWDNSDVWPRSMQHIAKEGRCYVLGITSCQRGGGRACAPARPRRHLRRTTTTGCHAATRSSVDPLRSRAGRTAHRRDRDDPLRGDRRRRRRGSRAGSFDVVGHYSRPDVFRFEVNRGWLSL